MWRSLQTEEGNDCRLRAHNVTASVFLGGFGFRSDPESSKLQSSFQYWTLAPDGERSFIFSELLQYELDGEKADSKHGLLLLRSPTSRAWACGTNFPYAKLYTLPYVQVVQQYRSTWIPMLKIFEKDHLRYQEFVFQFAVAALAKVKPIMTKIVWVIGGQLFGKN